MRPARPSPESQNRRRCRNPSMQQPVPYLHLEPDLRTRRQMADSGRPRPEHLNKGRSIGQQSLVRELIGEGKVLGREVLGRVKRDASDLRRDREGHRDVIIKSRLQIGPAHRAVELTAHALEAAEALDHTGAGRAKQEPILLEQAEDRTVKEEVDGLGLGNVLVNGEPDRIDAKQGHILGGPDMALRLGDNTQTPGARRLQGRKALIQDLFVDHRSQRGPIVSPPSSVGGARRCDNSRAFVVVAGGES